MCIRDRSYCHRGMFQSQEVINYINEKLKATWSPEQIACTPCELKMPSWRTIYRLSLIHILLACRDRLKCVSAERLYGELTRLLCGSAAGRVLAENGEILLSILPELGPCMGLEQRSVHHDKDVYRHMAAAVDAASQDPDVRWAAFLHDVGKPDCFSLDGDGVGHFYGHNERGAQLAREILTRLRAPRARMERVAQLVSLHDAALPVTAPGVRRWLRRMGESALLQLAALRRADLTAHAPTPRVQARRAQLDAFVHAVRFQAAEACYRLDMLAVNGKDVIRVGHVCGPDVGLSLIHI